MVFFSWNWWSLFCCWCDVWNTCYDWKLMICVEGIETGWKIGQIFRIQHFTCFFAHVYWWPGGLYSRAVPISVQESSNCLMKSNFFNSTWSTEYINTCQVTDTEAESTDHLCNKSCIACVWWYVACLVVLVVIWQLIYSDLLWVADHIIRKVSLCKMTSVKNWNKQV